MRTRFNSLEYLFLVVFWLPVLHYLSYSVANVNATNISKCIMHEREALLKFKEGIEFDYCGYLTYWGDHEDCCLWHGIRCSNRTSHVVALHLPGKEGVNAPEPCLEGKVNAFLFELKHLRSLDLSLNTFSQPIPKLIGSFTYLKHLNLSSAAFSGGIPHQLGNLSQLLSLDLSANPLFTSVKTLNWLSSLALLRDLRLSGSNLSEVTNWVQVVNLPRLKVLHLDQCQLSPLNSSSPSYSNSSTTLHVMDLSRNNLGTSVFQWLSNLSRIGNQLEYIDLSFNELRGPLPSELGHMLSLRVLDLSSNDIRGSIPKSYSNLCNLGKLDLSVNNLVEDLSSVIQTLSMEGCTEKPKLEFLDLGDNQLWGSVPDMIAIFSSLRVLHLGSNKLNGTISQGIGQLSMLESLFIYNNSLEGAINHNHFLYHSRLTELALSNNRALEFSVSADWIPPFQLDLIGLASCKLGPSFPRWLLTQTNISFLDISNSQISASIPAVFWTESLSSRLTTLNVSHNRIHGMIPNLSTSFDQLFDVDLSSNYFEGPIPSFLGRDLLYLNDNLFSDSTHLLCPKNQSNLWYLDLSNNLLSGELPDCWMKFVQLQGLHLEHNNFFGNIPASIGALGELLILHLENNNFSGEIPKSLQNCTALISINLEYNSLTGYIPSWIGYPFTHLAILNLRNNHFHGRLPLSLCQLPSLQILDLADNLLIGSIPKCFCNLTAMVNGESSGSLPFISAGTVYNTGGSVFTLRAETTVIDWKREEQKFRLATRYVILIDLSCNELQGKIPDEISSLKGLISLDLSQNNFSGSIATNIGQLTSLELLNLSNNHLSGNVPTSLAKVTFLGILDLSKNNFSGKIPTGTQLQGFNTSSYMGNPFLCGAPLPECSGEEPPPPPPHTKTITQQAVQASNDIYPGLYIAPVLGFIVGFWGVCGTLVIKRSWRHAFFRFFDDMTDKLCVMWVSKFTRAWRKT